MTISEKHRKKEEQYLIIIPGQPFPKERPRYKKDVGISYTPPKSKAVEKDIGILYTVQGGEKIEGPVSIDLKFYLKKPKKPKYDEPLKRPDMDNLIKTVLDALNGIAYDDDKQIVRISAEKHWAEDQPRTEISVKSYQNIVNF